MDEYLAFHATAVVLLKLKIVGNLHWEKEFLYAVCLPIPIFISFWDIGGMTHHEIFTFFLWIWMTIAVGTFILLRFVTAPYGRHTRPKWGPTLPNRLGWLIMESPTLILVPLLIYLGPVPLDEGAAFLAGTYLLHYIHRVLIFPFRLRTQGKQMPWVIVFSAIFFNLVNAGSIGYWLGFDRNPFGPEFFTAWTTWAGLAIFLTGAAINIQSDSILLNLRKGSETGYKIPFGGFFRFISCPNHFGEMVEWSGFALMCWSLPGISFAVWTIANLLPRALDHHKWYLSHFDQYPKERKAVIPAIL